MSSNLPMSAVFANPWSLPWSDRVTYLARWPVRRASMSAPTGTPTDPDRHPDSGGTASFT